NDLEHQHNVYRLYWPLADAHSFSLHPPTAEELAASPGIRPTIAGRPASAVQIAEELTRRRLPTPAPVSHLVPEQARTFHSSAVSPSQVPPEWTGSGSDLLAAAMQLQDEHAHDAQAHADDRRP
ncbi:MAG TPA: hypothetical protein PKJ12_04400, partial [Ottowia sp.]|nr:hypothetical protein [Ottowia sp.]